MSGNECLKDYIPKEITQQSLFLKKYPEYDGRGVVIAVLDSVIDVSLDGMQQTSKGSPKVIDCFDFTGAGNVDTSIIREIIENGSNGVVGLSGRMLKIPLTWKNPSGKWHLGLKSIYELCSKMALENIIKMRKEAIAKENEILKQKLAEKNLDKENYTSIEEYLQSTENLAIDSLVADCIVWCDGDKWHACLDTSFIGDLSDVKILTNFCDKQDYGIIMDQITYSVKIHDNGNLLEIITSYCGHGTGVAHVAAANYPNEPERNGLAPGVKTISMNVNDPLNGNLLSYRALKNALHKCIELKVDIINASIAKITSDFEELINEITEKHGIIFVKSAGNCGPVYSSVYNTDVLVKNIFVIGAVFTKKEEECNKNSAVIAWYSSRGPGLNGSRGINFVAPGDAVTAVPRFDPNKNRFGDGTSFSAPNASGAIACLISALKTNSIKFSLLTIKTALEKTAFVPKNGDTLGFGHGIIQINDAFEFLKTYDFEVIQNYVNQKCELNVENKIGIYSKFSELKESYEVTISNTENSNSIDNVTLHLSSKTESFVLPSQINNNSFNVQIKKDKLKSGALNYAEIHGINAESENPIFNQIFNLPITVITPLEVTKEENYCIKEDITLIPNTSHPFFITPPKGSYYCIIKITASVESSAWIFIQYAIENRTVDSCSGKFLNFNATKRTQTHTIKISWSRMYEISLMLYENTALQEMKCSVEIQFYGIYAKKTLKPKDDTTDDKTKKNTNVLKFRNYLAELNASMSMEINKVSYNLIPSSFVNENIKDQYDITENECLKLNYEFTVSEETKCSFSLNVGSKFGIFKIQIFTESKKSVHGFIDYFVEQKVTLLPGKYVVIAYVLHTSSTKSSLPPIESLPSITVTMELADPLHPLVYSCKKKTKETKYTKERMKEFKNIPHKVYFKNLPRESLPSPLPSTCTLHGTMNFCNENTQLNISFAHLYTFASVPKSDAKKSCENTADKFSIEKLMTSLCLNECTKMLKKKGIVNGIEITKKLFSALKENNFETFLKNYEILQTTLKEKNQKLDKKMKSTIAEAIFVTTNSMLDNFLGENLNIPSIFNENFGFELLNENCDTTESDGNVKMETKEISKISKNNQKNISKICKIFDDLADKSDIRKDFLQIKHALVFEQFGAALLCLNKISTKNQTNPKFKFIDSAIIELLKYLGSEWQHLMEVHEYALLDRHRNSYRLF